MSRRLLFVVNESDFFVSHRLPIALAAKRAGYEVIVATGPGNRVEEITDAGLEHRLIPLSRGGTNPLAELRLFWTIAALFRSVRPDLVHLVTIKPVLYGGILARLLRVPGVVAAISGMGYIFTNERGGLVRKMAELLYGVALRHANGQVIVQNEEDRESLRGIGALRGGQGVLIPGSGVDLDTYTPTPLPAGSPVVVLPARMLWDKGVGEFVEAAQLLRERGVQAKFVLVGPYDPHNPAAVPLEQLEIWGVEGPVEWWGRCDDMPLVLASASLVVLPSYREGMPKALLEAAAAGRAIVTTDAPGCRDVVEPGKSGELVSVRDARGLADTLQKLLADRERLEIMGQQGRRKAEMEFGISQVVNAHLDLYSSLCPDPLKCVD